MGIGWRKDGEGVGGRDEGKSQNTAVLQLFLSEE